MQPETAPQSNAHAPRPLPPDRGYNPRGAKDRYWLHALLFLVTFVTTTMAGAELTTYGRWFPGAFDDSVPQLGFNEFWRGLPYSISFLLFLTCHEFGHYIASRLHNVASSLPYYIPIFLPAMINIGSFGAVIRMRQIPETTRKYFDIGVAGPIAGFVVSVVILAIGFSTLPPIDYVMDMNPNYAQTYGGVPTETQLLQDNGMGIAMGSSILFEVMKTLFADPTRLPNHLEMFHYPMLFAGFITLFFTALNLLPIGQLDGGHVTYALFGNQRAGQFSRLAVLALVLYGGIGVVKLSFPFWYLALGLYLLYLVYVMSKVANNRIWLTVGLVLTVLVVQQIIQALYPNMQLSLIWLLYALIAVRVIRLDHPRAAHEHALSRGRKLVGWLSLAIFVLCFSPNPIEIKLADPNTDVMQASAGELPSGIRQPDGGQDLEALSVKGQTVSGHTVNGQ